MGNDSLFKPIILDNVQTVESVAYGSEIGSSDNIQKQDLEQPFITAVTGDILKQIALINTSINTILTSLGIQVVSDLPGLPDPNFPANTVVFRLTDRKLYRSTGSTWVMVEQGGSVIGLPFDGILGSGRHGAITISANTTATVPIPIYQLTTLEVQAGKTWTAYAGNPGGFVISVQGRCTIAGIIDVIGRGAQGGTGLSAADGGHSGYAGFNFGGAGGAGGGDGAVAGGYSGPVKGGLILGGADFGDISISVATTQWQLYAGAAIKGTINSQSGSYLLPAAVGAVGAGASGNDFTASVDAQTFAAMWCFFRSQFFGWGSGGGSGMGTGAGAGNSGAGGAGGGFVVILCDELDFTGTINANGANGANSAVGSGGGGGAGGGGSVLIGYRTLIANSGTVNVLGGTHGNGNGGNNGGDGGDGYYNVFEMRI